MPYKLVISKTAKKELKKIDVHISKGILQWLIENVDNSTNPYQHGKALTGDKSGKWRYRIGDYRVIVEIIDVEVIVLVLTVGHRKKVYKTK